MRMITTRIPKICRQSVLIFAGTLAAAVITQSSIAAEGTARGVRNVVLVHGAWADGSSWSKVIPLLEKAGLNVVAVQNPLTSWDDDVAAARRAVALQDGPVILVGHSYGGAVITDVGADPKVVGLVYVAAFAPDVGQALGDLGKEFPPAPGGAELRPDPSGFLTMTTKGVMENFAPDLPLPERKLVRRRRQRPHDPTGSGAQVRKGDECEDDHGRIQPCADAVAPGRSREGDYRSGKKRVRQLIASYCSERERQP